MSNYYLAQVGDDFTGFELLVKADSLPQARKAITDRLVKVERATDEELYEAARTNMDVLDATSVPSETTTDEDQQPLPGFEPEEPVAGHAATPVLAGETASGSAPAWLPKKGDPVSQSTGD